MIYIAFFVTLYFIPMTMYSSQSNDDEIDTSQWVDASQDYDEIMQKIEENSRNYLDLNEELSTLTKNTRRNFIQARTIIEQLRKTPDELDGHHNTSSAEDERLMSTTISQIQKLYTLANFSEEKKQQYNSRMDDSIKRKKPFTQKSVFLDAYFSVYLVIAECIFAEIFRNAQQLGINPNEDSQNL